MIETNVEQGYQKGHSTTMAFMFRGSRIRIAPY